MWWGTNVSNFGLIDVGNLASSVCLFFRGVFVKVSGKTMHAECFKCTTCGGPLKNVGKCDSTRGFFRICYLGGCSYPWICLLLGYFNISDKLYCENCARAAKAAQIIGIQNQFKEEQQQQKLQQPQPMQQMSRPQPQPQNPPQMSQVCFSFPFNTSKNRLKLGS